MFVLVVHTSVVQVVHPVGDESMTLKASIQPDTISLDRSVTHKADTHNSFRFYYDPRIDRLNHEKNTASNVSFWEMHRGCGHG